MLGSSPMSSNPISSYSGGEITAMAITQQASKLRPNEAYNSGSSGVRTSYYKFEFAGSFNQVQHLVGSKNSSGTPGTYKVQFAVTDTVAVDTVNNAYLPVRAGVVYNDKSANGWKDATFGGAASKQIGLAPSQSNNSVIHMSTDVMDLASVPRADGKPGGILLVKVTQVDPSGQFYNASGSSNPWDQARGKFPWFTEWYTKSVNFDAIADLTKIPTGSPYNEGYEFPGFSIVTNTAATVPMELLMFTGDSRRSAAFNLYNYATPSLMAAKGLSTASRPVSTVNAAGSGHNQNQYLAIAMDMLNNGLRPTVIHLPGFSQNGFSNFTNFKTANDNFMAAVRAMSGLSNVKFVLDTDYWVGGYTVGTSAENGRQQCIAYAKSLANGNNVFCFDSDAIITDYTNSQPAFKSTYFTSPNFIGGDGVHAGPVGLDAMTYGDGTNAGLQSVYTTAFNTTTTAPVIVNVSKDLSMTYSIDAPAPSYVRSDLQAIYSIGNTVVTVAANRVAKFIGRKRVVKFVATDPAYRGGKWYVAKGINDELFYAGDVSKQLEEAGTVASSVSVIAVGVTAITPPTLQGSLLVVKLGGFNIASDNYVTFRVVCENGERFDRTIIFERSLDDVIFKKDPDDQLFYAADVSEMLSSGLTTAVSFETIVAGVQRLSNLAVQGVVTPALIGGFDIATGVSNFATFRVTCANGERFDKTIRFEREET